MRLLQVRLWEVGNEIDSVCLVTRVGTEYDVITRHALTRWLTGFVRADRSWMRSSETAKHLPLAQKPEGGSRKLCEA